jgi:predicted phage terminase large subunit-like protein
MSKYSNIPGVKTTPKNGVSKDELIEKVEQEYLTNQAIVKPILEKNLFKFNRFILEIEKGKGMLPMAEVHKEMCKFIDDNKHKKKLALIPRGHLKSTTITVGRVVQAICENPTVRILIANATYGLACSFLTEVKRHLKFNEKIKMIWGDLTKDAEKWSENQITLSKAKQQGGKKEATVTAMGVESALTSQHYDIIIGDDLVNKDYVNTAEQIDKTIDFYKECLNLLEPDGEMILLGTRWDDKDLYGWILDRDNKALDDFEVFIREAYEGDIDGDDFKKLYPQKFTKSHLIKLREQQGPYIFSCQYKNNPISKDNADFKQEWFRYYERKDIEGKILNKFTMTDPAISLEKSADFTAMVTVGVDSEGLIYILDIERVKIEPNQLIDLMFIKYRQFKSLVIGIEDVAFQRTLQYTLSEEMQKRGEYLPIKPVKPYARSKDQRIRGLQPLYANGRILHCKDTKYIKNLEDELLRFPRGKHDDVIDALSYNLDFMFPAKKSRESKRRSNRQFLY